jgi:adenylosuccinate synthase
MTGRLIVVVGGQFGSEAKGHVAAQLAMRYEANLVIRVGGPNAGHTVYHPQALEPFKLRQLPTASVAYPHATIAIGGRSLVDPDLLQREMAQTKTARILMDPSATILTEEHRRSEEEDPQMQWGSTKEGIGAARADRIHRTAQTAGEYYTDHEDCGVSLTNLGALAKDALEYGGTVLVEAAQGYGLGLHTPYYPKTTSADCRAIDALADVGLSPWALPGVDLQIWVVVRPYPIRVAGESGPLYRESSWDELGLTPERTTVTNKVRRVGHWDSHLVYNAIEANGGPSPQVRVALTMVDQVVLALWEADSLDHIRNLSGADTEELTSWFDRVTQCGAQVEMLTTSPRTAIFGVGTIAAQKMLARFQ